MRLSRFMTATGAVVASAFVLTLPSDRDANACQSTRPPIMCTKSVVMAKGIPAVLLFVPPAMPGVIPVPVTVTCTSGPGVGATCPAPPVPVSATSTVRLFGPLPGIGLAATGTVSTAGATMPLPGCSVTGVNTPYVVPMATIPPILAGAYLVVGTVSITFSDGLTVTASGDQVVCLVEESADVPGQPRLDMVLLTPPIQLAAPGDQVGLLYQITNNDLTNSVSLTLTATSQQIAATPEVDPPPGKGQTPEDLGVYSIAAPDSDDFIIAFNADPKFDCLPLPPHPHDQDPITTSLMLGPGQSQIVQVGIRSWGQCATGSCSESTLVAEGTFANGDPALACAGSALMVDTSLPTLNWGQGINDCDNNGTYDPDELLTNAQVDENGNAIPDNCESQPCPWDCGQPPDGEVGINDFLAVLGGWGQPGPCDFDGGGVGITDFLKILGVWGACP